ncbi:hypothetical protein QJS66_23325 (plasmid) [Kocuria rhizophila]|nr:hypothetical protein QJS66_23325 [Kocuria rhizophila]
MRSEPLRVPPETGLLALFSHLAEHHLRGAGRHGARRTDGDAPAPEHVGEVVGAWWEETITAWTTPSMTPSQRGRAHGQPAQLTRYAHHDQLPRSPGAHASSSPGTTTSGSSSERWRRPVRPTRSPRSRTEP